MLKDLKSYGTILINFFDKSKHYALNCNLKKKNFKAKL